MRPLAKTAKFWRCANSAPRRPTEPLPASHHNTSVESKNIFFWILYWSHTKPSGSFPLQETMKPWASAPHADNLCKIWTRSAPISKSYDRDKFYIVFLKENDLKNRDFREKKFCKKSMNSYFFSWGNPRSRPGLAYPTENCMEKTKNSTEKLDPKVVTCGRHVITFVKLKPWKTANTARNEVNYLKQKTVFNSHPLQQIGRGVACI